MSLITRARKQIATYWKFVGMEMGTPVYESPREIKVRWDDVNELFVNALGSQDVSKSKVMVPEEIPYRSVLIKKELKDVLDWDDPLANEGALEVRGRIEHPNLKATEFFRQVIL